jgi:hypothetical protein
VIWDNGPRFWYQSGKLHRDDDKPVGIWVSGDQAWYQNGTLHRDGKPAVIYADGIQEWYQHGKRYGGRCEATVERSPTRSVAS